MVLKDFIFLQAFIENGDNEKLSKVELWFFDTALPLTGSHRWVIIELPTSRRTTICSPFGDRKMALDRFTVRKALPFGTISDMLFNNYLIIIKSVLILILNECILRSLIQNTQHIVYFRLVDQCTQ